MSARVEFLTTEFQFSYGRLPRGRGSWAFEVDCNSQDQRDFLLDVGRHAVVWAESTERSCRVRLWTRGSTTYLEAKAQVRSFLRGHFSHAVVNVCP